MIVPRVAVITVIKVCERMDRECVCCRFMERDDYSDIMCERHWVLLDI